MSKYKYIILFVICIFFFTGCNKNEDIEKSSLSFSEWAAQNLGRHNQVKKIECPEIKDTSIMSGSSEIFITDNNIYKYYTDKLFSNDKNCKLIGRIEDSNGMAVNRSDAIDENGMLYNNFWKKVDDINYNGPYIKDEYHTGWSEYLKRFNINKSMVSSSDALSHYEEMHIPLYTIITYTEDGLYAYYIDYVNYRLENGREFKYKISTDEIKTEKILRLYGSIIKTDKAYYIISSKLLNKEECEKYVDIDCEYSYFLKKDDTLTKYYDEILNITDEYFITKDFELISIIGYKDTR